jgi:hypothetical protein
MVCYLRQVYLIYLIFEDKTQERMRVLEKEREVEVKINMFEAALCASVRTLANYCKNIRPKD